MAARAPDPRLRDVGVTGFTTKSTKDTKSLLCVAFVIFVTFVMKRPAVHPRFLLTVAVHVPCKAVLKHTHSMSAGAVVEVKMPFSIHGE